MHASAAASAALEPRVLRRALADARAREAAAGAALAALLEHLPAPAAVALELEAAVGECRAGSATAPLLSRLGEAAAHAKKVSGNVRSLDRAARRVEQSVAALDALAGRREAAAAATDALAAGEVAGAARALAAWRAMGGDASGGDPSREAQAMADVEDSVRARVGDELQRAVEGGGHDAVARWALLAGPLGLADAAVAAYLAWAASELDKSLPKAATAEAAASPDHLTAVFNAGAAFAGAALPLVAAPLAKADGGPAVLQLVHSRVERLALESVTGIARRYRLGALAAAAAARGGGAAELEGSDRLLDTLAAVLQHVESWRRFAAHAAAQLTAPGAPYCAREGSIFPPQTALDRGAAELGGQCV
jgi:hypothetical protein